MFNKKAYFQMANNVEYIDVVKEYTTNGTFTLALPSNAKAITAEIAGAGGGGGGNKRSSTSSYRHSGGTGGTGGFQTVSINPSLGRSLTITVGKGGTGGAGSGTSSTSSGTAGGSGGSSSVKIGSTTYTSTGGSGGKGGTRSANGANGSNGTPTGAGGTGGAGGAAGTTSVANAGKPGNDGWVIIRYKIPYIPTEFKIIQSAHQTITVTCNGVQYTSDFIAYYGDTWTATITADSGYVVGTLSATSGTVTEGGSVSATPAMVRITITQSTGATITVVANGTNHTSTFDVLPGTSWTASFVNTTGYEGGVLSATSGVANSATTVQFSTAPTKLSYTFTITQSDHQTITVTCAGTAHTSTFTAYYGDAWTAKVVPDSGYFAGTLSATSGTITGAITVSATAAEQMPIWPEYIVSESGRKFGRHSSGNGTVMEWNDNGTVKQTIVFDAKYRTKKAFYTSRDTDLGLPTFTSTGYPIGLSSKLGTDATFNTKGQSNQDNRTNKAATDAIISKVGTNDCAAVYCRSKTELNAGGVDMPTINCLCRIYADSAILDEMDPTVSSFSSYSLGSWFGSDYVWSASWYGLYGNYYRALRMNFDSFVYFSYQDNSSGVVPVLDL